MDFSVTIKFNFKFAGVIKEEEGGGNLKPFTLEVDMFLDGFLATSYVVDSAT